MSDNPNKWRGSFEDFEHPDAPLVMFDIPIEWLESQKYDLLEAKRKEVLKDMLVWAIGADIIEGFSEIDDQLFKHVVIPVQLTDHGKRVALDAGGDRVVAWADYEGEVDALIDELDAGRDRVVAWAAGLTEHGVQVKLFAKSETPGQFHVMDLYFKREDGNYSKARTEAGKWDYGVISEWRKSLPDVILDAIQN